MKKNLFSESISAFQKYEIQALEQAINQQFKVPNNQI